jgi:hypothetical protein
MVAPGGTSLSNLLASMEPLLQPGHFVFATVPPSDTNFLSRLQAHSFEMVFCESEGWTLIADRSTVEALGLEAIFPCRKVTLGVHSSLDAVGFMAAVTTRLAKIDIGVNPVSGFYHDHLYVFSKDRNFGSALLMTRRFVREGEVDRVVDVIRTMAAECKADSLA